VLAPFIADKESNTVTGRFSVRNRPGPASPDLFRPGLGALYQAGPAALSTGFKGEKPGLPGSPSGPSDCLLFLPAGGTHIENVIEP